MAAIDFEAEGLLDGLEGDERDARRRLLAELADDGVELAELRVAAAEDRLALLPAERALGGGGATRTAAEIAAESGLERDFLEQVWRALGLAVAADDAKAYTNRDLEAAERVAALRDGGLPDDGILEVARVLGMTMSQLAAANRTLIADAFIAPETDEHEIATRLADAARAFAPMFGESLAYVLNLHLREQIRHDAIAAGDVGEGGIASAQEATVGFVDMVGFTRLGESLAPEELGRVSGRLNELAAGAVAPPVRLVKLIGDAAMIVGPEPAPVTEAILELVESADSEGDGFPLLRAGIATGPAMTRAGDWYGRPVNLASRLTATARPASVLVSEEVREALADEYEWSFAGARHLKGISGEVKLFRCRRLDGTDA